MDNRTDHRSAWIPWALTSVALVLVAIVAYNIGAHREALVVNGEPGVRAYRGFGFGGIWLLFLLFWIFGGMRWIWWGWGYPYRPWRYRPYDRGLYEDERAEWEEWHRREHDRIASAPSRQTPAPGSGGQTASS